MSIPSISPKSLKSQYAPLLCGVVAFDIAVLLVCELGAIAWSDTPFTSVVAARAVLMTLAPLIVLFLNSLIPADAKAILVFWRLKHVLPGHRAFTKYADSDARIDIAKLKKNVGAFPQEPGEQNSKWFALYKKVENDPSILHVHKQFLLMRDLAMLSLLLFVCTVVAWLFGAISIVTLQAAAILFAVQFFLTAVASRFQGVGMVKSVLALHSVKRRG